MPNGKITQRDMLIRIDERTNQTHRDVKEIKTILKEHTEKINIIENKTIVSETKLNSHIENTKGISGLFKMLFGMV